MNPNAGLFPPTCRNPQQLPQDKGRGNKAQAAVRCVAIGLAIGLLALAMTRVDRVLGAQFGVSTENADLIYLPPVRFLKGVSLGYEQALADVLWFRTISYFGRHYRSDRVYPWLANMCNAVTDLDPGAEHVYRFGGLILPWEADFVDDGIALLQKGGRNLPESWELKYILGFSYYFFKDDLDSAAQFLRAAARLPGAPGHVEQLALLVYAAHAGPNRAIDFLADLDRGGMSAEMSAVIRQRILELTLARDIDQLEVGVRAFTAQFGRPPTDLREIVIAGLVPAIPQEPFGGRYILDSQSGSVLSSSGRKPWRLGRSQAHEAVLERQRSGGGR
jgi:hypothetical protein